MRLSHLGEADDDVLQDAVLHPFRSLWFDGMFEGGRPGQQQQLRCDIGNSGVTLGTQV